MRKKDQRMFARVLIVALALICAFAVWTQHVSGEVSDLGLAGKPLYRIESNAVKISEAPVSLTSFDILSVDLDTHAINAQDSITADLVMPILPLEIDSVLLTDGWHFIRGYAEVAYNETGEPYLRVAFNATDLRVLDGTVGLCLILFTRVDK